VAGTGVLTAEYFHFSRIVAGAHAVAKKIHDETQRTKLRSVLASLVEASDGTLGGLSSSEGR
jgi:hypothetical protein